MPTTELLPTVVSLFSGAGGLDLGLEQAGFRVVAANDNDRWCLETLLVNQRTRIPTAGRLGSAYPEQTRVVAGGVENLDVWALRPSDAGPGWRPDLLAGGPPCQPFSSAGSQRSLSDPRGTLFEHFVRLAEELRPRIVLFENVRGLVTARGPRGIPGEALNVVRDAFEAIGYATRFALLNAADYGAPQRRVRLFMLAADADAVLPTFPTPTHRRRPGPLDTALGVKPWVTLGDFLAARPEPNADEVVRPSPELAALLAEVPAGSGLKSPGRAEPTRPGGHWGYKQGTFIADPDLPARTVTGASTQDWVRGDDGSLRRITIREAAALQGFPDGWRFAGSRSARFQQIGNAVPVALAAAVGRAIGEALAVAPIGRPASAPFPPELTAAIAYATRDDARNGSARPRSPRYDLVGAGR